jgi:hypothetical protein
MHYPDTVTKAVFFAMSLGNLVTEVLAEALMIFAFVTLGEIFSRDGKDTKLPLIDALSRKELPKQDLSSIFVTGYSLGFIFLGYLIVFYLAATRLFNIWMPPDTRYSNILSTALPFLFPLTIAVSAAVNEEFTYRMLAISFLQRLTSKNWLAILVPALLWGFAHSHYMVFPMYVRGIELTIFGIILGAVFLKYGLETVIIAHFVINASIAGLPLLRSTNPYYFISGIVVVALALLPPVIFSVLRLRSPKAI